MRRLRDPSALRRVPSSRARLMRKRLGRGTRGDASRRCEELRVRSIRSDRNIGGAGLQNTCSSNRRHRLREPWSATSTRRRIDRYGRARRASMPRVHSPATSREAQWPPSTRPIVASASAREPSTSPLILSKWVAHDLEVPSRRLLRRPSLKQHSACGSRTRSVRPFTSWTRCASRRAPQFDVSAPAF